MTPGQVAHDAGGFERKWERMGESQKADWERIAQAVLQAQPVQQADVAQAGVTKSDLVYLYWAGYTSGHHDTVEGNYTDVTHHDSRSYHADVVDGLISDCAFAQPVQPAADNSAEIARLQKASEKIDAKAHWINDEQATVDYTEMMELRAALKGVCAAIAHPAHTSKLDGGTGSD